MDVAKKLAARCRSRTVASSRSHDSISLEAKNEISLEAKNEVRAFFIQLVVVYGTIGIGFISTHKPTGLAEDTRSVLFAQIGRYSNNFRR